MIMPDIILEVRNLKKYFKTPMGLLHAVDDLSFTVERGKTLCIVGESGCGKTTTGRCILRLVEPTSGQIVFDGVDIIKLNNRSLRKIRSKMQIIFQDPYSSLDPNQTVLQTIAEAVHTKLEYKTVAAVEERVLDLMKTVGIAERLINSYPHELDGGRRQRIGIARALAMEPKFIVCDEPVSALDVSIQAQILNLLEELQRSLGLSYIFITHDLAVVNHIADDIIVMYLGQIVEKAPGEEFFLNPLHPYTKALLSAIPIPETNVVRERILLKGEVTSPINPGDECRFAKRCDYVMDICWKSCPHIKEVSPKHLIACHLY
jgi:peptide/nickel transport system ATP-binding protein